MPICPVCGTEVIKSAEICPNCGKRVKKQKRYPRMPNGDLVTREKNAGVAVLLSLLIPGAGVMYGGRVGLGILILLLTPMLMLLGLAVAFRVTLGFLMILMGFVAYIYGIYEGYDLCKQNNTLWYEYLEDQ